MKELYQEVDRKTSEKFGENSLAYKTITNGIYTKNIKGSQFFWNTNLGVYLPKNQRVVSLREMENIHDLDENFFSGFYTDTPQVVLRTNKDLYSKNQSILENLVKQVKKEGFEFSPENPLVISNLRLIKDKNSNNLYGLTLELGDNSVLKNDSRFAYSKSGEKIQFGSKDKTVYNNKDNGLSRVCLNGNCNLNARSGNLASSDDDGRVVLVSDAEGVALKILEEYKLNLENEEQKQIDNIKNKYKKAREILEE